MEAFSYLRTFGLGPIFLRLLCAVACGALVGLDREIRNKKAGLKTHSLVCLGAALCVVVSESIALGREGITTDATRLAANVITGVGFLCAATLMVRGNGDVRGLTTAAGLWAVSIIGLACGSGWVEVAILSAALVLVVFGLFSRVDERIERVSRGFDLYAELRGDDSVQELFDALHGFGVRFSNLEITENGTRITARLTATTAHLGEKEDVLAELRALPGVHYLEAF